MGAIIILPIAAFITGMFVGLSVELWVSNEVVRDLEAENKHLRVELAEKQRIAQMEYIEILDHRESTVDETEDFFAP